MEDYRLIGIGGDLESRWTHTHADDDPREALEAISNYFNTAIVQAVFARAGAEPAEYDAEDVYLILTTDDAPESDDTAVRRWLEDHEIDPEALAAAFVSTRAMHRYLQEERGLEIPVPLEHPPEVARRPEITAEDLQVLIRETDDPKQEDRLRFIRHLYEGEKVPAATEAVGYNPSTGYRWLRAWEEGGLDGLLTDGASGWRKLTPGQERQFVSHLASADRWPTEEIEAFLQSEFDVSYDDRHLMRKLEGYGLEKIHYVDAYRWSDELPDEPAGRVEAALEGGAGFAVGTEEGRDATG